MNETEKFIELAAAALREVGAKNSWAFSDDEDSSPDDDEIVRYFLSEDLAVFENQRIKLIEQEGGGEGGGEYVYAIIYLDGAYYKAEWNYYSHYGYDFDDLEITRVVAKEKMVIVYEKE